MDERYKPSKIEQDNAEGMMTNELKEMSQKRLFEIKKQTEELLWAMQKLLKIAKLIKLGTKDEDAASVFANSKIVFLEKTIETINEILGKLKEEKL